jgi:hypothetical protein
MANNDEIIEVSNKKNIYAKSKIYKLVLNDLTYYGSTVSALSTRKSKHKSDFKRYQDGKIGYMTSFDLFALGNPEIVLIESFSCDNKEELFARERYYIENFECINKNRPNRTPEEKKEYDRKYRKDNYENEKEYKKQYHKERYAMKSRATNILNEVYDE